MRPSEAIGGHRERHREPSEAISHLQPLLRLDEAGQLVNHGAADAPEWGELRPADALRERRPTGDDHVEEGLRRAFLKDALARRVGLHLRLEIRGRLGGDQREIELELRGGRLPSRSHLEERRDAHQPAEVNRREDGRSAQRLMDDRELRAPSRAVVDELLRDARADGADGEQRRAQHQQHARRCGGGRVRARDANARRLRPLGHRQSLYAEDVAGAEGGVLVDRDVGAEGLASHRVDHLLWTVVEGAWKGDGRGPWKVVQGQGEVDGRLMEGHGSQWMPHGRPTEGRGSQWNAIETRRAAGAAINRSRYAAINRSRYAATADRRLQSQAVDDEHTFFCHDGAPGVAPAAPLVEARHSSR